jgi:hypothetical protein
LFLTDNEAGKRNKKKYEKATGIRHFSLRNTTAEHSTSCEGSSTGGIDFRKSATADTQTVTKANQHSNAQFHDPKKSETRQTGGPLALSYDSQSS